MSVENIPVLLNFDQREPVGFGEINDKGELIITVTQEKVTEFLEKHVGSGRIMEIRLGFGYRR